MKEFEEVEEAELTKFELTAEFWAEDLDDALAKLGAHFTLIAQDIMADTPLSRFGESFHIRPVADVRKQRLGSAAHPLVVLKRAE